MKKLYKYTLPNDIKLYNRRLEGYNFNGNFGRVVNGIVVIYKGYSWDGCSPKIAKIGSLYIGTPDFNGRTKDASLIHDFLYQFKIGTREIADYVFYEELIMNDFIFAGLYYNMVRKFGKKNWDK